MNNSVLSFNDSCCWAVIIANQDLENPFAEADSATTMQLVRTAKYCQDHDLLIERVFILDNRTGYTPFYKMIDFIKRRDYKIAVVADTPDSLFVHHSSKMMALDYLYHECKIEIHLVQNNVILKEPYDRAEEKAWTNINLFHPDYRDGIRHGIRLTKEFARDRKQALETNKEEN